MRIVRDVSGLAVAVGIALVLRGYKDWIVPAGAVVWDKGTEYLTPWT